VNKVSTFTIAMRSLCFRNLWYHRLVSVVGMILNTDASAFQVTVIYLTTYNLLLLRLSWRNLCFISVYFMHHTLVSFLESEHTFLNDKEQNSSSEDHLSASKVSPPVLINLIFRLMV
jgi:hypothetical protein